MRAGVPTVVARRMMQSAGLVGRLVESAGEAAAAAADGASLVILADVRISSLRQACSVRVCM